MILERDYPRTITEAINFLRNIFSKLGTNSLDNSLANLLILFNFDSIKKLEEMKIVNYVKDVVRDSNACIDYKVAKQNKSDSTKGFQNTMISQIPKSFVKLSKTYLSEI